MASSSICPKCSGSRFEAVVETPRKSNFKLLFVRCETCGTVVGVLDAYNIGALIHDLAEKINVKLND